MQAAIILVGDELLSGHTRDANAYFLARALHQHGHRLRRVAIVPDERSALVAEVEFCLPRYDITFLCGGLGPTHDDRTSESLAERFARRLVIEENAWSKLHARYNKRGDLPPATVEAAKKMVSIPEGAEVLDNPAGAAPGYVLREGDRMLVVLPGVPAEMQSIFERGILGKLLPRGSPVGLVEADIEMPEAAFAAALGEVAEKFADVEIGSYPHYGEKHVTLRFKGDEARARLALAAFFDAVPEAKRRA